MSVDPREAPTPRVKVRYWAAARSAAGVAEDELSGSTVAEVLEAARGLHADSSRFASVLSVCSILVGDSPVGSRDQRDVAVADGDTIEVLPPFAGG
jgi:molybdopterin converting factor small subunit